MCPVERAVDPKGPAVVVWGMPTTLADGGLCAILDAMLPSQGLILSHDYQGILSVDDRDHGSLTPTLGCGQAGLSVITMAPTDVLVGRDSGSHLQVALQNDHASAMHEGKKVGHGGWQGTGRSVSL